MTTWLEYNTDAEAFAEALRLTAEYPDARVTYCRATSYNRALVTVIR